MNPHAKESYCAFLFDEPEFYESFMREIVEAMERGKANTHLLNNLGIMHWETGDPDQAMECLEKAVAIDPKNAIAFKNIGMLAEKQGNKEGALPAFREALRLKPDDYSIQLNNAYLLLELGRACEAIPFFEKAISLGFDNEVVRENLAKARVQCGEEPQLTSDKPQGKKRSLVGFYVAAGVLLLLAGAVAYMLQTPPVPAEWKRVRVGMTREELMQVAPGHASDMRSEKGFDMFIRRYRRLLRPCWWQMRVTYNADSKVRTAAVYFTDPNCGWFNRSPEYICEADAEGGQ
jgi:tetratricopeptide (TPR) repeat protein